MVVASISLLVHIYSTEYVKDDRRYVHYYAFLSLFTAAMLFFVMAQNIIQLIVGWELVGVCSFVLIGHWWEEKPNTDAALKAFLTNRVGDIGLLVGMIVLWGTFQTFDIDAINTLISADPGAHHLALLVAACCLMAAVASKSGQFPLHTWLPDAMAGPTPVSALIHAATMVTSGIYLLTRVNPIIADAAAWVPSLIAWVGVGTALFAATIAMAQTDIKKVLAYSTVSQLGYMFLAVGCGAYVPAIFHMVTHAFFKALLFLGAGSVIHAVDGEQDMRYMGGLRKHIPITFWTMTLGTLAITGVGIPLVGVGFAGFYSKDGILEAAFAAGGAGIGAYYVGVFAALLTSFYSWRLVFLTFFGKPRWAASEHIQHALHDAHGHDAHGHDDHETHGHGSEHDNAPAQEDAGDEPHRHGHDAHALPTGTGGYHPHESGLVMLIPLIVLSLGAVFAGFLFHDQFIGAEGGIEFWNGALAFDSHLMHAAHEVPTWVKFGPFTVMAIGLLIAWLAYIRNTDWPQRFVATFGALYQFLLNKWYFDELYHFLFVKPAFAIGRFFWKFGDVGFIDRFGPNGLAALVVQGNKITRRIQSGSLYPYALVMLIGLAAAATWAMTR